MADSAALNSTRYRLLLTQLRDEWMAANKGSDHGWKADAARRLGIKPEYIGMIEKGDRPDAAPIAGAVDGLALRPDFFFDVLDHEPHYTEYLRQPALRLVRDVPEMTGVSLYFKRNPHHERFRAAVNRHLNASVGDVAPDLVKSIVRGLEDLEAAEAERQ